MHPYATDSNERKIVTAVLGAIGVLLSFGVSAILDQTAWPPPEWLPIPTAPILFAIGYFLYDRWIWRVNLTSNLRFSRIPYLAGEWN